MSDANMLMVLLPQNEADTVSAELSRLLGCEKVEVIHGSVPALVSAIEKSKNTPQFILIDIGSAEKEILPDIDILAEHCEADTRVVIIGNVNDVTFYRELRQRGIMEYFTRPVRVTDIQIAFFTDEDGNGRGGKVFSFIGSAAGDGSSTIALNTAYSLANDYKKSVVLVDMDYQFGMVAKNLDLAANFGIKELFEHPDRGIDNALVDRMLVSYGNTKLKIIAAPNELKILPTLNKDTIQSLIQTLRMEYDVVVLDLPHLWAPWVSTTLSLSTRVVLVAQLWLRSVTHSSRILNVLRAGGVNNEKLSLVINRSGAKFKEAISARDFERVCDLPISHYFSNDTRTIVAAENHGKTVMEGAASVISKQIREFAGNLLK